MFKRFVLSLAFLVMAAVVSFQVIFTVPEHPQIITQTGSEITEDIRCIEFSGAKALDDNGELNLLVWNIYKQNRANWQSELELFSAGKQLLLLQEASMTDSFKQWLVDGSWVSNQVSAFKALGSGAGVISIAQKQPIKACAYTSKEPWLRLPKSALYSQYRLSNGESLAVINVHAINFTVGTEEYTSQLSALETLLKQHSGPIVFAGDFNSWSEYRITAMKQALREANLREVQFSPDHRTQFITGLPLDHVFYRGLTLKNAKAPQSDASDHNPLLVAFTLND
ncbi:TPA: endonuclease/exonuclease/phosphatase family protein [Vibrio parahaemolyticus]|uniref:endonuclease/exonuclease/phosphatase family protein n=1 Tax=Vibrio parahaemolyticus TaxID=670 RepID=UPI0015F5E52C|nr:endonuclease/exonuclease/phosphatase family protein [Vibrio parahaemolyticus]EJG0647770.1 endonuclease/exonuclease/phosphatase family protein [Vibrio parahaemolyticus]MCI9704766.1 endonuclease/exonuclease/phosphatase family protein [Vibrio parahaemolyticus]MDF4636274.1 endonuclease/exonuclease/phosphatase family protein [Vibrio parahaemolyticus]MDF5481485.1 endonuclease/exonuclease/phosphatase family protein [Vibrio parahaemolyticus]MDG2619535.1 endonuclease/exonuclease/phosphatase family p